MNNIPLFLRKLPQCVGMNVESKQYGSIVILSEPRWQINTGKWNCLANVHGALVVMEIVVTPKGIEPYE